MTLPIVTSTSSLFPKQHQLFHATTTTNTATLNNDILSSSPPTPHTTINHLGRTHQRHPSFSSSSSSSSTATTAAAADWRTKLNQMMLTVNQLSHQQTQLNKHVESLMQTQQLVISEIERVNHSLSQSVLELSQLHEQIEAEEAVKIQQINHEIQQRHETRERELIEKQNKIEQTIQKMKSQSTYYKISSDSDTTTTTTTNSNNHNNNNNNNNNNNKNNNNSNNNNHHGHYQTSSSSTTTTTSTANNNHRRNKIKLNIGGTVFVTSLSSLTSEPDNYFTLLFSELFDTKPDEDGEVFIDRNPKYFSIILDHLRSVNVCDMIKDMSAMDRKLFAQEVDFYQVRSLFHMFPEYLRVDGEEALAQRHQKPVSLDFKFKCKLGSRGTDNAQFIHPFFVMYNNHANGEIYVSDFGNHRVQKLRIKGNECEWMESYGSRGTANGQFNYPTGIAINSKGHILVADCCNYRVQIFDENMQFIQAFGSQGSSPGLFNTPTGIAVDDMDYIYVADRNNHRVQMFGSDGTYITSFGSKGSGNKQFNTPWSVALSGTRRMNNLKIYVSDYNNHRIQVLSCDGKFLYQIGSNGTANGQLRHPGGLTVTEQGYLIVCDYSNHRAQVFDTKNNGQFVKAVGGVKGSDEGQFSQPYGVTTTTEGNVIICEWGNHRVQIFD